MSYLEIAREFEAKIFEGRVDRPRVEEWEFRHIEVPSQEEPGNLDVWLVGERKDKHEILVCYFGTISANSSSTLSGLNRGRGVKISTT